MMIKRNGFRQINIQDIPSAELSGPKYLLNPQIIQSPLIYPAQLLIFILLHTDLELSTLDIMGTDMFYSVCVYKLTASFMTLI